MMDYNGSAVVAMAGNRCVGIACDKRLGVNNFRTVANNFQKCFKIHDTCYVGMAGLATDVQTMQQYLRFRVNLYRLREEREMDSRIVSNLIGTILYSRRYAPYLVTPVLAGLDSNGNPVISTYDYIGAISENKDFVFSGSAFEQLSGVCESFWKPNMDADELFETISQCLLAAVDRDCVSGWGAVVHIITPDLVVARHLKSRQD